jgi:hypothetical protein
VGDGLLNRMFEICFGDSFWVGSLEIYLSFQQ